jgi:hypothetical protein
MDPERLKIYIRFQVIQTRIEGMKSANELRKWHKGPPEYTDVDFQGEAAKLDDLVKELGEL